MRSHDFADDGEAEAGPFLLFARAAPEPFENVLPILPWHAAAAIGHLDPAATIDLSRSLPFQAGRERPRSQSDFSAHPRARERLLLRRLAARFRRTQWSSAGRWPRAPSRPQPRMRSC